MLVKEVAAASFFPTVIAMRPHSASAVTAVVVEPHSLRAQAFAVVVKFRSAESGRNSELCGYVKLK
jgi:hypothetical protein